MQLKKYTQKDRYGNTTTYEFEGDAKPVDQTKLMEKQMDMMMEIPQTMAPPVMGEEFNMGDPNNHPGEPRGQDTVPAWLTPGEFVVNAEATEMFGPEIEAMNEVGKMAKGGWVSDWNPLGYLPGTDAHQRRKQQEDLKDFYRKYPDEYDHYDKPWDPNGQAMNEGGFLGYPSQTAYVEAAAKRRRENPPDFADTPEQRASDRFLADPYTGVIREAWRNLWKEDGGMAVPVPMLDALLHSREGYRDDVYLDSLGKPTVGAGHLLPDEYKSRVGERPFTDEQLHKMFDEDRAAAEAAAQRNVSPAAWDKLNKRQQATLASMAFQLGEKGQSKFKNMLAAIEAGDHNRVAREALTGSKGGKSKWLKQTPVRALDLAEAFDPELAAQYRNAGGQVFDDMETQYAFWGKKIEPSEIQYSPQQQMLNSFLDAGYSKEEAIAATKEALATAGVPEDAPAVPEMPQPTPEWAENLAGTDWSMSRPTDGADYEVGEEGDLGTAPTGVPPVEEVPAWAENLAGTDWTVDEDRDTTIEPAPEEEPAPDFKPAPFKNQRQRNQMKNESKYGGTEFDSKGNPTPVNENRYSDKLKQEIEDQLARTGNVEVYRKRMDKWNAAKEQADAHAAWKLDNDAKVAEVGNQKKVDEIEDLLNKADELEENGDPDAAEVLRKKAEKLRGGLDGVPVPGMTLPTPKPTESEINEILKSKGLDPNQGNLPGTLPTPKPTPEERKQWEDEGKKQPPSVIDEAKGILGEVFGELFSGKELARMAIMYAGSRALGYDHSSALNWSAKQYVRRVDEKSAAYDKLATEGKFTPESVKAARKDDDLSKLVAVGTPKQVTGNTMVRSVDGKKTVFQEVKVGDSTYYIGPDGSQVPAAVVEANTQPYEAAFEKGTPEYRARRSRATGDAAARFEEVFKSDDSFTTGSGYDKSTQHYTKIRPKQAADEFWAFMEKQGFDPESDAAYSIMTNAYRAAINDAKTGDIKPTSLRPYLEQEFIRHKTGSSELFVTNPDREVGEQPTYVQAGKMNKFLTNLEVVGSQFGKSRDEMLQKLMADWAALGPEGQDPYSGNKDESPFYNFAQQQLAGALS